MTNPNRKRFHLITGALLVMGLIAARPRCEEPYSVIVAPGSSARLNTDLLKERFGPITVRVLRQGNGTREVSFVDQAGKVRGYAKTAYVFPEAKPPAKIAEAQSAIEAGGSMGETFRRMGFTIEKVGMREDTVPIPAGLPAELGRGRAVRRTYRFVVVDKGGERIEYADLQEWTPE